MSAPASGREWAAAVAGLAAALLVGAVTCGSSTERSGDGETDGSGSGLVNGDVDVDGCEGRQQTLQECLVRA